MSDPVIETLRQITPYTILGANIRQDEFDAAWAKLQPDTQSKVSGACSRIALVDAIQHEARLSGLWEQVQSEALQVYLLCTCFDALAGQDYKQFHVWVSTKAQNEHVSKALGDTAGSPLLRWYRKVTNKLAQDWLKIYGVTKNYRELFETLPQALRGELASSYAVIDEQTETLKDWETWSEDRRLERILEYLYKLRRNTFTHQAKISPTVHTEQGVSGVVQFIFPGFWDYSVFFLNLSDIRGEVSLLRTIATGKMRAMLGYEVDEAFLDLHWRIERYKRHFRVMQSELISNERCSFIYLRDDAPDLVGQPNRGLWKFKGDAAKRLNRSPDINLEWFDIDDGKFRQSLSRYLDILAKLNEAVTQYKVEASNPDTPDEQKVDAYEEIRRQIRETQLQSVLVELAIPLDAMLNTAPHIDALKQGES